jgi:hypothetical protein
MADTLVIPAGLPRFIGIVAPTLYAGVTAQCTLERILRTLTSLPYLSP